MRGIDVYQGDGTNHHLPLKSIPQKAYNESDFVIIKATQGTSYKYTSFFKELADKALKDKKLVGAYHYAEGGNPVKEADYFISVVKKYLDKIILCLDWERWINEAKGIQNHSWGSKTWCQKFINRIKTTTGITCFLYTGIDGCNQNLSLVGKVPLWFAGYPKPMSTNWTVPKWKYNLGKWGKPTIWQYTSSNEKCDRNTTTLTKTEWEKYTKIMSTTTNPVNKIIKTAETEVGYLEKKSNTSLDNKTANAGKNNYTKYGKWIGANGDYWCASFICWIFYKAFGLDKGRTLLCGSYSAACEVIRQNFIKKKQYYTKNPKAGDVIFFSGTRHSGANHIGLVTKVTSDKVYTVEGNTSGASGIIDNGGGVAKKSYALSNSRILGYGRPNYSEKPKTVVTSKVTPYYPKYTGKSKSIVDALKAVGVSNVTFTSREKIAKINGITNYTGSSAQNTKLLKLLKAGRLKKV